MARKDEGAAAPRRAFIEESSPEPEPERLTFAQHVLAFLKELTAVVVGAVIVASLLRGFVGQMFLIPSVSMEDTLRVSDRVVVEKLSTIKRGEIVVFKDPGGWLTGPTAPKRGVIGRAFQFIGVLPDPSTEHLIKRVIGMPGDKVVCCDAAGRITVNDTPLEESGYLFTDPDGIQVSPSTIQFEVLVPAGHIFVMGDHRDRSSDSRCHLDDPAPGGLKGENAFVDEDLVVGRGVAVAWPFARRHTLPIPDTFEAVPPGKQPAPDHPEITAGSEGIC
ncbi:MAG TPA: signal peptidase I [Propionibacteriaceae bacterium]|nr:signal peptidase I [Propionibacteriaceae bacterium]